MADLTPNMRHESPFWFKLLSVKEWKSGVQHWNSRYMWKI